MVSGGADFVRMEGLEAILAACHQFPKLRAEPKYFVIRQVAAPAVLPRQLHSGQRQGAAICVVVAAASEVCSPMVGVLVAQRRRTPSCHVRFCHGPGERLTPRKGMAVTSLACCPMALQTVRFVVLSVLCQIAWSL